MDCFGGTDGSQVTVALVSEYHLARIQSLNSCRDSRRTSVSRFDPVDVQIIIGKNGASDRRDADRFIFHTHLGNHFGNQLVYHAVTATGTVVHGIFIHQPGFPIYQVFRFNYFVNFHVRNYLANKSHQILNQAETDCRATAIQEWLAVFREGEVADYCRYSQNHE